MGWGQLLSFRAEASVACLSTEVVLALCLFPTYPEGPKQITESSSAISIWMLILLSHFSSFHVFLPKP